jgi:hypothetical protein
MLMIAQKEVFVIGMIAAFILAAAAITVKTTESTNNKETQTTSEVNDCGNGGTPADVFCQTIESQIKGDDNSVIIRGKQGSD